MPSGDQAGLENAYHDAADFFGPDKIHTLHLTPTPLSHQVARQEGDDQPAGGRERGPDPHQHVERGLAAPAGGEPGGDDVLGHLGVRAGGDELMAWHARLGYAVASLLLFRLAWGLVGEAVLQPSPGDRDDRQQQHDHDRQ